MNIAPFRPCLPCGRAFYNGRLPLGLPFWTPKKEAKKVPATCESAGGPPQGLLVPKNPKVVVEKQKS